MPAQNKQPLLQQLSTNPLLIDPTQVDLFEASVAHVLDHEHAAEMVGGAMGAAANDDENFWATDEGDWRAAYRPYNVVNGVLQIPVMGVLLNRFPYQLGRWATGYKYIEMAVKRGLSDDNVKKIAFVIDSPGGEVAGCFEVTDFIYENRGAKPMRSFAADHAYSAAYSIYSASGEGNGTVTRSGGVGSIGVVTAHVDFSEAYKMMGVKVTYIFRGKHKVDGNSAEPLPAEVKARIEKRLEKLYSVFTSTVARNRGMDEQAIRDTEALTYDADDGIANGLADRLGSLEDEMAIFADEAINGDEEMATAYTQEQMDAATATARTEGHAAGVAEGKTAGAAEASAAATARMNTVLDSEEGKKRPKASVRALKTSMSAEEIVAFLADLPEEKAEVAAPAKVEGNGKTEKTHFEAAMDGNNPEVGADASAEEQQQDDTASNVSSILGAYGSQAGVKPPKRA